MSTFLQKLIKTGHKLKDYDEMVNKKFKEYYDTAYMTGVTIANVVSKALRANVKFSIIDRGPEKGTWLFKCEKLAGRMWGEDEAFEEVIKGNEEEVERLKWMIVAVFPEVLKYSIIIDDNILLTKEEAKTVYKALEELRKT